MDILKYRGFEITLNLETGKFNAWSDMHDTAMDKPTLTACKKSVDNFITNNLKFAPFKIQKLLDYGRVRRAIDAPITIVGMRKDGRIVHLVDDVKKRISDYEIKNYCLYDFKNEATLKEITLKNEEFKKIKKKYDSELGSLKAKLITTPLNEKLKELDEIYKNK